MKGRQLSGVLFVLLLTAASSGCVSQCRSPDKIYSRLLDPHFADQVIASQHEDFLKEIPKIDMHEHYKAGGNIQEYFKSMPLFGVKKVFLFPTGKGPDNRGYRENMAELLEIAKIYPDRVVAFASVEDADPQAPAILEDAVRKGARGLKLMSGHPNFYKAPLDNPLMIEIFEKARELKIPVLMHISPAKFSKQAQEFENLVRSFPEVTIIAAHYGRTAPQFKDGDRLLNTYPNLFMDVSMGGGLPRYQKEMQLYLKNYRNFVLKHKDRLMWGTDIIITKKTNRDFIRGRMVIDFLVLGKSYYVDTRSPIHERNVLLGLKLPKSVLKKIFYDNPKRIFKVD